MDYSISGSGEDVEVALSGRFTLVDNEKFREILKELKGGSIRSSVIDLSRVEYMDSAGLGMLILLKDASEEKGFKVSLRSPQGQVRKILEISRFDEEIPIDS